MTRFEKVATVILSSFIAAFLVMHVVSLATLAYLIWQLFR